MFIMRIPEKLHQIHHRASLCQRHERNDKSRLTKSEMPVGNRRVFLVSLMQSVTDFQGWRLHFIPKKESLAFSQAIHRAWFPCAAQGRKFTGVGGNISFNWVWISINNQWGTLKSSAEVVHQKLGLTLGGTVFDQHPCPWSRERVCKHWTSVLFPVDPPGSVHNRPSPACCHHC